jgi:hypothetical protein
MNIGTKKEPYTALGIAAVWALYGGVHFLWSSKKAGKSTMIETRPASA